MVQVPTRTKLTVLPATLQTAGLEEEKATGLPEAPPVAVTVYVPPYTALSGGVDVNEIDWFAFWTVRLFEALLAVKPLPPANLADTPLFRPALYVPAAMTVPVAVPFDVR